jgi:hypothetical protein
MPPPPSKLPARCDPDPEEIALPWQPSDLMARADRLLEGRDGYVMDKCLLETLVATMSRIVEQLSRLEASVRPAPRSQPSTYAPAHSGRDPRVTSRISRPT